MNTVKQVRGDILLAVARNAIARQLGEPGVSCDSPSWLDEPGASFVTLTQQGKLRGCVGSTEAYRPLGEDVSANAIVAALRDHRFSPLKAQELAHTRIEVSLLSSPEEIQFDSETNDLAQLRPGVDGVLLQYGSACGTFLPQVWESLPHPADFLAQLKSKVGLPADFWHEDVRLSRYTVNKWKEPVEVVYEQA